MLASPSTDSGFVGSCEILVTGLRLMNSVSETWTPSLLKQQLALEASAALQYFFCIWKAT
jgi:hypothetical protein